MEGEERGKKRESERGRESMLHHTDAQSGGRM